VRSFRILLLLLLLGLPSPPGPAAAPTLRVLTFNVWHGLRSGESKTRFPGEEAERMERRFQWQIEEIRRLGPDVLLLQEVNPNQRQARRYAAELGYDEIHKVTSCGIHLGKLLKIPRNVNEGLAILARPQLGLQRVGSKRLSGDARCSATCGFQTKESRYVLFGEITFEGRPILLATTHLSSPPWVPPGFEEELDRLVRDGALREEQREEIVRVLERKRARNLTEVEKLLEQIDRRRTRRAGSHGPPPVILGGDFNTEPETEPIVAIEAELRNVATGPGFLTWDPVTNHVNYGIGSRRADPLPTFDMPEIRELLGPRRSTPRQIDFIFVSRALESVEATRAMDRERDGILPSDHFAVLAVLRLAD
jgi:endonuclease/exonuclease/phosphatase family metal-dependent hydrolase